MIRHACRTPKGENLFKIVKAIKCFNNVIRHMERAIVGTA